MSWDYCECVKSSIIHIALYELPEFIRAAMSEDNVPLPSGFRAAGVHCGIKKDPAVLDLALFVPLLDSPEIETRIGAATAILSLTR